MVKQNTIFFAILFALFPLFFKGMERQQGRSGNSSGSLGARRNLSKLGASRNIFRRSQSSEALLGKTSFHEIALQRGMTGTFSTMKLPGTYDKKSRELASKQIKSVDPGESPRSPRGFAHYFCKVRLPDSYKGRYEGWSRGSVGSEKTLERSPTFGNDSKN